MNYWYYYFSKRSPLVTTGVSSITQRDTATLTEKIAILYPSLTIMCLCTSSYIIIAIITLANAPPLFTAGGISVAERATATTLTEKLAIFYPSFKEILAEGCAAHSHRPFTETKKQHHNTSARANKMLHK